MDLAVNIAIGSSAQVALFVAPFLVIASYFVGPYPLALVFNGFELGAIVIAILIANYVIQDGESTWFEGVQLLAVYLRLRPELARNLRFRARRRLAGRVARSAPAPRRRQRPPRRR